MGDSTTNTVATGEVVVDTKTAEVKAGEVNTEAVITPGTEAAPDTTQTQLEAAPSEDQTPEWAKKRFAELTAARKEAEREREFFKKLALERDQKAELKDATTPVVPKEPVEPKLDDFTDYGQYVDAVVEYKLQKALHERDVAKERHTQHATKQTRFAEQATKIKAKLPDYETVLANPEFVQSPIVYEGIISSECGPQIAYYLAKNLDVVKRLNDMSPFDVAREIGKLEATLNPPAPRQITKAPDPIKPIGAGNEQVAKDPATMSMDDYAAANAERVAWKKKGKGK